MRGSGDAANCTIHTRKGDVIARTSVVWDGSGSGAHRRRYADRTSTHKGSFLAGAGAGVGVGVGAGVDAGTCIGHRKRRVKRMMKGAEVVVNRKGGRDVRCRGPHQGRSMQADVSVARRGVDRGDERRCWKLEKFVSGEETEGNT